jgi:hypothetical protein
MKKSILQSLATLLFAIVLGSILSSVFGINASVVIGFSVVLSVGLSLALPKFTTAAFGMVYSPIQFTGDYYEEIFNEVLFMNSTIEKGLVRVIDNVNTEIVLTESTVTRTTQSYTPAPNSMFAQGNISLADKIMRPFQFMIYDEFAPNNVIYSRLGRQNVPPTSFPKITDEFQRLIIARYGAAESQLMESRFWNAATDAAVELATTATIGTDQDEMGVEEQSYIQAAPSDFIDGVLTKLILTYSGTKKRIKVKGITIDVGNIAEEYARVYAAILPQLLQPMMASEVKMFVPHSHLQLINTYNTAALYRDLFRVSNGEYFYNNVKIEFVPLPENAIIAGVGQDIIWGCDITAADASIKMDFLAANSENMFIKAPYTQQTAVIQSQQFVVYVG